MVSRTLTALAFCAVALTSRAYASDRQSKPQDDVRLLYTHSETARSQAAERLVATGKKVIPLVLPVLCDNSKPNFGEAWASAADVLGRLRAKAAAPCLTKMLMYEYPSIGPVVMKSDETLASVDPAFKALVEIGDPAVPEIGSRLPFLMPDQAIMALRVLRLISTPMAREAAKAYVKFLDDQSRFARQIVEDLGEQPNR